jgi:mannan endo-1,6-alpha-mannosidase
MFKLLTNLPKSNGSQAWTDTLKGFVNASSIFTDDNGVLVEVACERNAKCDIDQRAFKGAAVRSFARAAQAAPLVADPIAKMLSASAQAAARNCNGSAGEVACSFIWSNSSSSSSSSSDASEQATSANGNLGEVLNALQAVQALLWRTADFSTKSNATAPNATATAGSSGTSGVPAQSTGAGATIAASFTFVVAVAFAAALGC